MSSAATRTHATPEARAAYLAHRAAVRALEAKMEAAILSGTGAVVEVTFAAHNHITVSAASPEACKAAGKVMALAGCTLRESCWDDELKEQFDYWQSAPATAQPPPTKNP